MVSIRYRVKSYFACKHAYHIGSLFIYCGHKSITANTVLYSHLSSNSFWKNRWL